MEIDYVIHIEYFVRDNNKPFLYVLLYYFILLYWHYANMNSLPFLMSSGVVIFIQILFKQFKDKKKASLMI